MLNRLYLDHNATSPLRPAVRDAMLAVMEGGHNPSSVHGEGRAARVLLESARALIADRLSAPKEGIVFTGSGTEADNWALNGLAHGPAKVRTLFVSSIEHEAISLTAQALGANNVNTETIPVTGDGVIDLEWFERRIASYDANTSGPFAVCVMLANNETGVIQPVDALGPIVWPKGGFVVVDAVQGIGKLPINFDTSGADIMTIAAHKIGGPVGIGAVLMKPGIPMAPMLLGGGQEQFRRAGTENIVAIAGFAKIIEIANPDDYAALTVIRDEIESGLPESVMVWGKGARRLANTLNFSAPGFASETQVMVMDLAGIAISAGSACSSGKVRKSTVLDAMGADEASASCAIRISLGWNTPVDAPVKFLTAWNREFYRVSRRAVA